MSVSSSAAWISAAERLLWTLNRGDAAGAAAEILNEYPPRAWLTAGSDLHADSDGTANGTNTSGFEVFAEEWLCEGERLLPAWDGDTEAFQRCLAYSLPLASHVTVLLFFGLARSCGRRQSRGPSRGAHHLPRLYHAVLLLAHVVVLCCSLAEIVRRAFSVGVVEPNLAIESVYRWMLPLVWGVSLYFIVLPGSVLCIERYSLQAFWTLSPALSLPLLYNQLSFFTRRMREYSSLEINLLFAQLCVAFSSWIYFLRWSLAAAPAKRDPHSGLLSCPMAGSGPLNRLMFNWCWPLVKLGATRPLELSDMWAALTPDAVMPNYLVFRERWDPAAPSLVKTLLAIYYRPFLFCGLMQSASAVLDFVGPVMLGTFVDLASSQPDPATDRAHAADSLACVAALTLARGLSAFLQQHTQFEVGRLGLRLTGALKTGVYVKLLRISAQERQARSGDVVNLLTVDVQRVTASFMGLWNALVLPAQIIVAMVMLWKVMGPSMLAGLGGMLAVLAANYIIAAYQKSGFDVLLFTLCSAALG